MGNEKKSITTEKAFMGENTNEIRITNVCGVDCYEKDGTAYLRLETVARGLGFVQMKNDVEYVKWERISSYLEELGFSPEVGKESFIPENIFYRLAMKAKNDTAEKFQAKVADEIIPTIRKTDGYVADEDLFIVTYLPYADDEAKALFKTTLTRDKSLYENCCSYQSVLSDFKDKRK